MGNGWCNCSRDLLFKTEKLNRVTFDIASANFLSFGVSRYRSKKGKRKGYSATCFVSVFNPSKRLMLAQGRTS